MGGLNEVLAVILMTAKYELPAWPHADGVGYVNMCNICQ